MVYLCVMAAIALGFFTLYIFIHLYILSSTQKLILYFLYARQRPGVGDADMNKKNCTCPHGKRYTLKILHQKSHLVWPRSKQRKSQVSLSYDSPKIRPHTLAVFIYLTVLFSFLYVCDKSPIYVRLFGPYYGLQPSQAPLYYL